jgi:asparagine synthase (glutamine-hydrolysing)
MPGIVGLVTRMPRVEAESQLRSMLKAICHEDFYSTGTWVDEALGVYVGWAVLKGSFADGMPLLSTRGDVCIVFSGEEFSDYRAHHRVNRSSSIKSEATYLIERHESDPNFVQNLNGLFHGLIADRTRNVVTLFNDRYSMHRLCYHQAKDAFYFGAEAKAILAVRPELRNIHLQSLGEFASLSCILEGRTLFKDIHVLPAASEWSFRNAQLERKNTYFSPEHWENQTPLSPESFYQELRSVLANSLPRYFVGRQQMGIAMTGGLDTRVILAYHPPTPGTLPSYTFGGPFRESQDVMVGRKIASICQQPHQVIQVSKEFLDGFPKNAERTVWITEGTVDVSRADLYLSQQARKVAPAKIVGTYGSEIVRHAVMFKPVEPLTALFSPDFLPPIRQAESTYAALRRQHPVTFAAFSQSPWYHHGVLALEQSQLTVRSPFLDNDFVRTVYQDPSRELNGDVRLSLIKDGSAALAKVRSDRGVGGNGDRLSSAFLRAYLEFTFKAEYAYDYGMPQSVARIDHALSALRLERLFLGRHKLLHFRLWYRDQLSNYVRQMLLDPLTLSRPYVQKKTVEAIVRDHLTGNRNYTIAIHKLLTLELVQRLFVDSTVSTTMSRQKQAIDSRPMAPQTGE